MNKPAAIMGSLVDARNVGAHKSVKLTIHVPAERAMQVFEAFGWPTAVEPVSVAVARINTGVVAEESPASSPETKSSHEGPGPRSQGRGVSPEKRLVQQAAICCGDPVFQKYLTERLTPGIIHNEETAAEVVRQHCDVESRSEILIGTPAANRWDRLYSKFVAWREAA